MRWPRIVAPTPEEVVDLAAVTPFGPRDIEGAFLPELGLEAGFATTEAVALLAELSGRPTERRDT